MCVCGRVCVNARSLLSCHVDDRHIVGILEVLRCTTSLFSRACLRHCRFVGFTRVGQEERPRVSVTADPHSHVIAGVWGGLWGEPYKHTHSPLFSSLECSVHFFAEPNQTGCVSELSLVYQTAAMSLHRFTFVYRSLEQTAHCLASQCGKRGQGKMMRWGLSLDLVKSEQANRCLGPWRFE